MVRAGLFKDVDATLYWHPSDANTAAQDKNLANTSAKFRFHGQSAHAPIRMRLDQLPRQIAVFCVGNSQQYDRQIT